MNKTFKLYPGKPAHIQIVEELIAQIEDGRLLPGEKLNDITRLQQMFSVSKGTMLKSIRILTTLGFVHTIERQGIYICAKSPEHQDCTDKVVFAEYSFTHFTALYNCHSSALTALCLLSYVSSSGGRRGFVPASFQVRPRFYVSPSFLLRFFVASFTGRKKTAGKATDQDITGNKADPNRRKEVPGKAR